MNSQIITNIEEQEQQQQDEIISIIQIKLKKPVETINLFLTSPDYFITLACLLFLFEVCLCYIIIRFIPCK